MLSSIYRAALILLSVSTVTMSCRCRIPQDEVFQWSLDNNRNVFRGVVTKKLKPTMQFEQSYVVRVSKVYKGCSFVASQRIVVSTGGDSPLLCQVPLAVNGTYAFSGVRTNITESIKAQLATSTKVTRAVYISPCSYNVEWSTVKAADLKLLKSFNNTGCPVECSTAADCPTGNYCDATANYNGSCKRKLET